MHLTAVELEFPGSNSRVVYIVLGTNAILLQGKLFCYFSGLWDNILCFSIILPNSEMIIRQNKFYRHSFQWFIFAYVTLKFFIYVFLWGNVFLTWVSAIYSCLLSYIIKRYQVVIWVCFLKTLKFSAFPCVISPLYIIVEYHSLPI